MEGQAPTKPSISVVCVTNRPGAVDILKENMDRQTFRDFEVIIADDSRGWEHEVLKHFKPREKAPGDAWNLNKAYNDALAIVDGELIVFLQDYIWIPANGLQRFWEMYKMFPNDLVTGVGHKAKEGLEGISEIDDRANGAPGVFESNYSYYELNWASCPTAIAPRFDEDMDTHYGGENVVFALKAQQKGAKIWVDRSNRCIGYNQSMFPRPTDWESRHCNKGFLNKKLQEVFERRS